MTINMDLVVRRSRIELDHFHLENDPVQNNILKILSILSEK